MPAVGKKTKVLVIDDTPDIIIIATALLETLGAEVSSASSGESAINKISESQQSGEKFDLLLLDIHMPGMNGNQVAKKARDMGYCGAIVVFTANPTMSGKVKIKEFGIDAYLNKTQLNKDILSAILSAHCSK